MSAFPQALQPQLASLAASLQSDPSADPSAGVLMDAQEAAFKQHARRRAAQTPPAMRPGGGQGYGTPLQQSVMQARQPAYPQQQPAYPPATASQQPLPMMGDEGHALGPAGANVAYSSGSGMGAEYDLAHARAAQQDSENQMLNGRGQVTGPGGFHMRTGSYQPLATNNTQQVEGQYARMQQLQQQAASRAAAKTPAATKTPDFNHDPQIEQAKYLVQQNHSRIAQLQKKAAGNGVMPGSLAPEEKEELTRLQSQNQEHMARIQAYGQQPESEFPSQIQEQNAVADHPDVQKAVDQISQLTGVDPALLHTAIQQHQQRQQQPAQPPEPGPHQYVRPSRHASQRGLDTVQWENQVLNGENQDHELAQRGFNPQVVNQIPKPSKQGDVLPPATAQLYLQAANGDVEKARQLARTHGYSLDAPAAQARVPAAIPLGF